MSRRILAIVLLGLPLSLNASGCSGGGSDVPGSSSGLEGGAGSSGSETSTGGSVSTTGESSTGGEASTGSAVSTGGGMTDTGSTGDDAAADDGSVAVGDGGVPNIDPGRNLDDLSDAERGALCDWMNALYGGYGNVTECSGTVSVMNPQDQASCVASYLQFRCMVTVGEFETCISARAPSHACDLSFDQCRPLLC